MELIKLSCNGCGADIELPEDARFVTCRYCGAKLEVKKTDGAMFTEVREAIEKISDEVASLKAENRVLRIQNEIDELDREWQARAKGMLIQAKDGSTSPPTRGSAYAVGVGALIMLIPLWAMPSKAVMLPVVGVASLFAILALAQYQRAVKYEAARAEHEARRDELGRKLEKAEREANRAEE